MGYRVFAAPKRGALSAQRRLGTGAWRLEVEQPIAHGFAA